MRKIALFVALAMIAASPALAAPKKSKRAAPAQPAMTDAQRHNDNGARLVRDSLPMWLPSYVQPFYQNMKKQEAAAQPAKRKSRTKTAAR
jgi:hypothetical protein